MERDTDRPVEVGDVVHFVLPNGPNAGAHRPAIVVGIVNGYTADLQVFSDGHKGAEPRGDMMPNVFWKPGCVRDEQGKSANTWHEREPRLA